MEKETDITRKITMTRPITPKESQLIRFISEGLSNKEIAQIFSVSTRTVESRRSLLNEKTGSKNAPHLIWFAFTTGILP